MLYFALLCTNKHCNNNSIQKPFFNTCSLMIIRNFKNILISQHICFRDVYGVINKMSIIIL